ncbi:flagellin N-terminal helical domain-containing protein [Clostridium sp. Marseille-P2415]|uniref:flagellin N-terminal helical domain-containing protein n=1 Tax=Clostridium sp. Marseille-P2415 TaxID=1805471 RepID=UPI00098861B1|nr:flagellin [Clostridium sp. Marseille-P2415]
MRIQHNIAALNSYRNLSSNNSAVSKNLEKLSSGYKINRAGDDAAGLAISEKMRAQITGLETAQKNANDGISLVQTAEGALTEVHSMLNRMVELADQSANGTYQDEVDRENLQSEIKSLRDEVNRIADGTNFNGITLLDGSMGSGKSALTATGFEKGSVIATNFTVSDIKGTNLNEKTDFTFTVGGFSTDGSFDATAGSDVLQVSAKDADGNVTITNLKLDDIVKDSSGKAMSATSATAVGDKYTINLGAVGIGTIEVVGTSAASTAGDLFKGFDGAAPTSAAPTGAASGGGVLRLQIGDTAADFNQLEVSVGDMHAEALGIGTIDISTQAGAKEAIDKIKSGINKVSSTRGDLGAIQNRLEHTINNLSVTTENMTAAESRIRDVDMADEMMAYTKNNILVQASQAMLAQANQVPQGVLQLLQ